MIRRQHAAMAFRYLTHRFRKLHPFEVEAVLLNQCTLHCSYCLYPDREKPQMTIDQWKKIIRSFADLGTMRFKFHGGEPTLRPDFRELSAEVKASGMITAAVTNGTIIPERPDLLDHLDELVISFDSPNPDVNDRIRGNGSHRAAVQTIELSLQRGIKIYVNMVLTRENLPDVEAMLEYCEARGIRLNAQPIAFGGLYYVRQAHSLALTPEEIREVHRLLVRWKKQGRGLLFSKWAYKKVLGWPDYSLLALKSAGVSSCVAGRDYVRIECNGDVLPCCQYNADFEPKNILRDGLKESLIHVQTHNCGKCWLAYYNERTAVFRLRPGAVWGVIRRG